MLKYDLPIATVNLVKLSWLSCLNAVISGKGRGVMVSFKNDSIESCTLYTKLGHLTIHYNGVAFKRLKLYATKLA